MHWLPLVAMVIASALPFPHSPVSRIVEATLDAVTSPDPPAQPPSEHDSKTNSAPGAGDYLTTQNKRVGPSAPLSDSDSARDVSSEAPTAIGELRTSDCDNYNNVSLDNSTMQDYKPDGSISTQGRTNFRDAKDKVHERNDNTALEPRSGVGGGQRELGPTLPWEKPETGRSVGLATVEGRGAGGGVGERLEEILQTEAGVGMDGIQEWDELFLDAHPRVLFAPSALPPEHPPLLLMLESDALPPEDEFREEEQEVDDPLDADGHTEGHGDRAIDRSSPAARGSRRSKRSHLSDARRGELSVCESESAWVRDKKTATDQHGHTVTVLSHIQTQTGRLNQYFYETHCRQPKQQRDAAADQGGPGLAGGGCLGVDKKQWRSECKAKQSFVRALTKDTNERIGWRWIRIDSSCVCVLLSRVNRRWAAKV